MSFNPFLPNSSLEISHHNMKQLPKLQFKLLQPYSNMVDPTSSQVLARQCMIICLCFLFLVSTQRGLQLNPYQKFKSVFDKSSFEKSLDQELFCNVHRMGKASFYILLSKILPNLSKKCKHSGKLRLSHASMVSITLSHLGSARICNLRVLCRPMHKKVLFSCIWNAVNAINETRSFSFPTDHASLLEIEQGFRSKSRRGCMKGCLDAIDGMHFQMLNPGKQMSNPNRFFVQRKNKFSLLCIACCNSNRKFTFFDCSKCSKSHDSMAFHGTEASDNALIPFENILFNIFHHCKLHNLICKSKTLPKWTFFWETMLSLPVTTCWFQNAMLEFMTITTLNKVLIACTLNVLSAFQ